MKLNRIIAVCALAAIVATSATSLLAQNNGGGQGRQRGNWDPAQMQQRMMDAIKDRLEFTNDTDWSAVQPLVQKVLDARRDVGMGGGMRALFGGRNRGGDQAGGNNRQRGGGMFSQPSPEEEALSNALENNAPAAQIKDLLAKYKASKAAKQAKLEAAQDALKAVLTSKQEAEAYLIDLVR